jgi:beta-xylosidase
MTGTGELRRTLPRRVIRQLIRHRSRRGLAVAIAAAVIAAVGAVLVTTAASAATVDLNAWYVLVNRTSGKAMDDFNFATNDGAIVVQWARHNQNNQQWRFIDSGGGFYRLQNRLSGKVLDNRSSTSDGTDVVQWTDQNTTGQQFSLADSAGGYVRLLSRHSGKAVEVQNASTADGGRVVQFRDFAGNNQQWQLVRWADINPSPSPAPSSSASPTAGPWPPSSTFGNPVAWQDFADIDIIRVGNVYYYSASTMHYSPGAPILRSYDLVNWEFAGHSVPRLDFGSKYDMSGARGYVRGIWASTLNYRPSNSTFYWMGCIDFSQTYVYTATAVDGTWQRRSQINNCYYDAGLLIDDNDTMYVAYGNTSISVAQLSADGLSQVRTQQVFSTPSSIGTLEGARFYKRNGSYYIFLTRPANGQYILKASNPFGPYEIRQVLLNLPGPVSGGGVPHQGGLVQTQNGAWYYMAFVDSYPGGRIPVLAPVTWTADGWPQLQTVNNAWGASYPYPNVPRPPRTVKPLTGSDTFSATTLGPQWEWNHNPDTTRFSVGNGLRLGTATVTNDLYSARNTLTHRIQGPTSTATIQLDYSAMRDGDRAGLALLRDSSAWIGIKRDNGSTRVVMTNGLSMDASWNTTGTGSEAGSANVSGGRIWLRANADIRPGSGRQGRFSYSTDGVNFTTLGPGFTLNNAWQFFMGYRFGIFNYATTSLGGTVTVNRFDLSTP